MTGMLEVRGLSKAYGSQVLFDDASFSIGPGERIGLVARNGHGKTTLFRMLLGREEADRGEIRCPPDYRVGHLSQQLVFSADSVLAEAARELPVPADGRSELYRAEAVLQGLGFDRADFDTEPRLLSGGFQVRLNLAALLVSEPNLLLLDEPTNYLDIVSIRWLERFLRSWPRELVVITHDRGFMDKVVTHTLGIHRGVVRKIDGITAKYYQQVEQEEEVFERTRLNQEKRRRDTEDFVRRFRAKASKAKAVQSRLKALQREQRLERLDEIAALDFRFRAADFPGRTVLEVSELEFGYVAEPLIRSLNFVVGRGDRIGVVGKNGKGKSTLLRLLAGELQPRSGALVRSPNVLQGYFGQTNVERLNPEATIEAEVLSVQPDHSRTIARSICGVMMFSGDLALKQIKVLSGGEKSRVLLGKVLAAPANLLLLDEPTNHLDQESARAFAEALESFSGAVVVVTHNEELLRRAARRLIVFDGNEVVFFPGGYDEFLERVGWSDERTEEPDTTPSATASNKKELRRQRAEIVSRRSKELRPLKKRIAGIEDSIIELEQRVAEDCQTLIEATRDGFGDAAAKLSRTVNRNKAEIERLFEDLEDQAERAAALELKFEKELEQLGE